MIARQRGATALRRIALGLDATVATLLPVAAVLAIAGLGSGEAHGETAAQQRGQPISTIGRTWPIVEPDALAEIEAKVATLPKDMSKRFGPRSSWSALKAASLGSAPADRVRTIVPFYTLDFDIKLPDGRTLYPKGYTFNPLTYVRLPQRLVVVDPRDLGWALRTARTADFVLVTAGDAIDLSERSGRPIYILEDRVKERLGLTVAPVIVAQDGPRLILTEVGPRSRSTMAKPASKGPPR